MKLELKHITPYLPYGVHLMNSYGNWHNTTLNKSISIYQMLEMKLKKEEIKSLLKDFTNKLGLEEFKDEPVGVSYLMLIENELLNRFGVIRKSIEFLRETDFVGFTIMVDSTKEGETALFLSLNILGGHNEKGIVLSDKL